MQINTQKPPLWLEQFSCNYDFRPSEVKTRYIIASTPRSGSHFLSNALYNTKYFGYPLEYFNERNLGAWKKRAEKEFGDIDLIDFLENIRTSSNGCFGIKLHYNQISTFISEVGYEYFLNNKFILLRRRDILGQAISWSRASQTKAWKSDLQKTQEAVYDFDSIDRSIDKILYHSSCWEKLLLQSEVNYLEIFYEDMVANTLGTIKQIADFMLVDFPVDHKEIMSNTGKQRTLENIDWRERYIADAKLQNQNKSTYVYGNTDKRAVKSKRRLIGNLYIRNKIKNIIAFFNFYVSHR